MAKRQARRKRRSFTPEFKAEAVRLCRAGDRSMTEVAKDLDLTETALREWVKRADEAIVAVHRGIYSVDVQLGATTQRILALARSMPAQRELDSGKRRT